MNEVEKLETLLNDDLGQMQEEFALKQLKVIQK